MNFSQLAHKKMSQQTKNVKKSVLSKSKLQVATPSTLNGSESEASPPTIQKQSQYGPKRLNQRPITDCQPSIASPTRISRHYIEHEAKQTTTSASGNIGSFQSVKNDGLLPSRSILTKPSSTYQELLKEQNQSPIHYFDEDDALSVHSWEDLSEDEDDDHDFVPKIQNKLELENLEYSNRSDNSENFSFSDIGDEPGEKLALEDEEEINSETQPNHGTLDQIKEVRIKQFLEEDLYDMEISDNKFLKIVLGQLEQLNCDVSYSMFRSKFLPQHRKANFGDFVRFRRLEARVLAPETKQ